MTQFRLLLLVCSGLLCIKPALAGNSLDALFDKETGHAAATPKANQPAHTTAKQKAAGLDDLMEQEQADEARQRKLAEEKRKAEEERQRRLAEDKRRRDEAQRLAEQRQREIDNEREREDRESRERQSTKDTGLLGFGIGVLTGNRNLATAGLQQTIDGEKQDFTGAYKQDLTEQKQRDDAEARRREAEAARIERMHRQQEAEAERKVAQDTRQIEAYNRQQQQQRQQQADQQRQQEQQRQEQQQQAEQRRQEAARQAKLRPVTSCVTFRVDAHGSTYGYNHCNIKVQVRWHETQNGNGECVIEAGGRCTASTQAFGAHEYVACEYPAWPNIASGTCE